jgi:hypothetical protein
VHRVVKINGNELSSKVVCYNARIEPQKDECMNQSQYHYSSVLFTFNFKWNCRIRLKKLLVYTVRSTYIYYIRMWYISSQAE